MAKTLFGGEAREVKPYNQRQGIIKPVLQIKDGIVINRFDSIKEAGRSTNIIASSISDVCRGKNKTTGGYVWKYAEYEMPVVDKAKRTKTTKVTAIKQQRKGPFKVVITELCDNEQDAKTLLSSLMKTGIIGTKSGRVIQTRKRK